MKRAATREVPELTLEQLVRAVVALRVGEACTNGHEIQSEADLYRRATGAVECRVCRRAQRRSHSETRPTRQRRAEGVRATLMVIDEALRRFS